MWQMLAAIAVLQCPQKVARDRNINFRFSSSDEEKNNNHKDQEPSVKVHQVMPQEKRSRSKEHDADRESSGPQLESLERPRSSSPRYKKISLQTQGYEIFLCHLAR